METPRIDKNDNDLAAFHPLTRITALNRGLGTLGCRYKLGKTQVTTRCKCYDPNFAHQVLERLFHLFNRVSRHVLVQSHKYETGNDKKE